MHHGIYPGQLSFSPRTLRDVDDMRARHQSVRNKIDKRLALMMCGNHEQLEPRCLLAADVLATDVEIFGREFQFSQSTDEADGLLVRFRDDALCTAAKSGCGLTDLSRELPGQRKAQGLLSVPGLREVKLRSDANLEEALTTYRNHPSVLYAEPNYRVSMTQLPNDPRYTELWGLENLEQTGGQLDVDINAPEAWDVTVGNATLVAVIDTGVDYNHEDLAANMWVNPGEIPGDGIDNDGNGLIDDIHGYDFVNNDGDPMDDQGHGTHVAGTIGAVGNNGIGVTGVNWNAQIMAVKFLDSSGSGSNADAIRAVNYAVQWGQESRTTAGEATNPYRRLFMMPSPMPDGWPDFRGRRR